MAMARYCSRVDDWIDPSRRDNAAHHAPESIYEPKGKHGHKAEQDLGEQDHGGDTQTETNEGRQGPGEMVRIFEAGLLSRKAIAPPSDLESDWIVKAKEGQECILRLAQAQKHVIRGGMWADEGNTKPAWTAEAIEVSLS